MASNESVSPRLINPAFRRLWLGQLTSGLGDALFETTLVVWIVTGLGKGTDWAPVAVSGLLAASAIPVIIAGPLAGVLVDRWADKRAVMLRSDLFSALAIFLLMPISGAIRLPGLAVPPIEVRVGAILFVTAIASAIAQFFRPASGIIVRDIVLEPDWPRAIGALQTARSVTVLIGPAIAAPLLVAAGPAWALGANAVSFVVSWVCVRAIDAPLVHAVEPPGHPPAFLRELAEGLRFFRGSRVLVTIAVSLVIVMFGLGAVNALDVFFLMTNLGASASFYGVVSAAYGVGMVGGALLAPWFVTKLGEERVLWSMLGGIGTLFVIYSRLTNPWPALVVLACAGLLIPALNVAIGPLMMRETPRELMGRVGGLLDPMITVASVAGMLTGGLLYATLLPKLDADIGGVHFGPLDTLFLLTALIVMGGAVFAWARLEPSRRSAASGIESTV